MRITNDREAIKRALEVVREKVEDWEFQGERVAEWENPVIVTSSLVRLGERQVYVLKGYVCDCKRQLGGWLAYGNP